MDRSLTMGGTLPSAVTPIRAATPIAPTLRTAAKVEGRRADCPPDRRQGRGPGDEPGRSPQRRGASGREHRRERRNVGGAVGVEPSRARSADANADHRGRVQLDTRPSDCDRGWRGRHRLSAWPPGALLSTRTNRSPETHHASRSHTALGPQEVEDGLGRLEGRSRRSQEAVQAVRKIQQERRYRRNAAGGACRVRGASRPRADRGRDLLPGLREGADANDALDEADVEHSHIKELVAQLEASQPGDDLFEARFTVLSEYVEHHAAEEEKTIFAKARKAECDLVALGEQLLARKEELGAGAESVPGTPFNIRRTRAPRNGQRATR